MAISPEARRILGLRRRIEETFDANSWMEVGALTGCEQLIEGHDRLLRSLSWGDPDYSACVLDVLNKLNAVDTDNLNVLENYLANGLDGAFEAYSGRSIAGKRLSVAPRVFDVPECEPVSTLLSAMMPFDRAFDDVYEAIKQAANTNGMNAERADNVWEHSTIIQDIFSLIYRSNIVVCDFSLKNTNVFYEAGIAHTLGRHVIPIAQHASELPFDLQHHRAIFYQPNPQGVDALRAKLAARIQTLLSSET